MIERFHHSFAENIKITKNVVDYAHDRARCSGSRAGQIGGNQKTRLT